MNKTVDVTGQRFGRQEILEYAGKTKNNISLWRVKCDCGYVRVVRKSTLTVRKCVSCRKCYGLPPGRAVRNDVYQGYKDQAKKRGLLWNITDDEFDKIVARTCHYCGADPRTIHRTMLKGAYSYTGIDRKDNGVGYVSDNIVPCCRVCNFAKRELGYEEFISWIYKASRHLAASTI